jgi:hypothetical protein
MPEQQIFRHGSTVLSGIKQFKNAFPGGTAIMCCSGTSFKRYDDRLAPKTWKRFAINETIRKMQEADYWVLSDSQIVKEYATLCPKETTVLCMNEATAIVRKRVSQAKEIHTVESMRKPLDYDNGFEFFSRGTVLIGGIEMARYMGFRRFFVFGCDCYRLADEYYYDGRTPIPISEKRFDRHRRDFHGLPTEARVYITERLKLMIDKLEVAKKLWGDIEIHCVDSPWSRQKTMPLMELAEFKSIIAEESKPKRGRPRKKPQTEAQVELSRERREGNKLKIAVTEELKRKESEVESGAVPTSGSTDQGERGVEASVE